MSATLEISSIVMELLYYLATHISMTDYLTCAWEFQIFRLHYHYKSLFYSFDLLTDLLYLLTCNILDYPFSGFESHIPPLSYYIQPIDFILIFLFAACGILMTFLLYGFALSFYTRGLIHYNVGASYI